MTNFDWFLDNLGRLFSAIFIGVVFFAFDFVFDDIFKLTLVILAPTIAVLAYPAYRLYKRAYRYCAAIADRVSELGDKELDRAYTWVQFIHGDVRDYLPPFLRDDLRGVSWPAYEALMDERKRRREFHKQMALELGG